MSDGRYSVAFPRRWWYPACRSQDLGTKPRSISLMDTPLVVFRGAGGRPAVLLDRCPHRNYPLSLGRMRDDGVLQCGYHGWRFDSCGACVGVPGLPQEDRTPVEVRSVPSYAALEQDGLVWVWGEPDTAPTRMPFALPEFSGPGTGEVVFAADMDCTMHASIENALDVPHTAFLHAGIFRGTAPKEITAVRHDLPDGVEAQYLGEPAGMGPIQPKGGRTFDHWDRFFLPSIAQVEYKVDGWFRVVNTIVHLPLSPFRTRAWFVVRFWSKLPASLLKPIVLARGKQILGQDARALGHQTARIRDMGGERYTSTDLDILGTAIWRLLRQAERAEGRDDGGSDSLGDVTGNGHAGTGEQTVTFTV